MPTPTRSSLQGLFIAVSLALASLIPVASGAGAQVLGCIPDPDLNRIEMGAPDAQGNSQHVDFSDPSVSVGFHFTTSTPTASLLYIGDQWYDLNLFLYARGVCEGAGWEKLIRAWSVRAEYRVIQFMRPNEQIVNLVPGEYLMVAQFNPVSSQPFDASKGFTARVATASPYCSLDPPDELQPNPTAPSIMVPRRPDEALYQLGMSIDPPEDQRVPFTLMSFNAILSPPYGDLFDYAWTLDGQPLALEPSAFLYQIPVEELPRTPGGQHTIQLAAIGARYYPDPGLTHLPPTLTVKCLFGTAQGPAAPATSGAPPAAGTGGAPTPGTGGAPSTGGGSNFQADFGLLQRCKTMLGVVGAYTSTQQVDQVVACYVQQTVAAGSPLSPAEIEQGIRRAIAF
jgi:hypothetical protein